MEWGSFKVLEAPRRGREHRRGFTMIELCIALSLLVIGLASVVQATSRMHSLRKQNRERILAQNAIRSISERVHARSYVLSKDPDTWAEELALSLDPGGFIGSTFEVQGLNEDVDDPLIGSIRVFTDERLTDGNIGFQLGMPRDLNGDGDATDADVRPDGRVLPVLVTVHWRGETGTNTYRHGFWVMGY